VTRSPVRDTSRVTVSPITARPASSTWNPSVENGILTSANQPCGVRRVRDSQNASQLPFSVCPSSDTSWSKRIPEGVVPNQRAFWSSLNESM
jgi:hypothetical protein